MNNHLITQISRLKEQLGNLKKQLGCQHEFIFKEPGLNTPTWTDDSPYWVCKHCHVLREEVVR